MQRTLLLPALLVSLLMFSLQSEAQLKKRIAVSRFEDRSGHGYHGIGQGVADMLSTALVKTGKFMVMERQELDNVIAEQKLGESGLVTAETAPKVGKLLGVELLVVGSISEFGTKENTIGGGVSLFGGGITRKTARATVDIRLVNTTTGEVIATATEEGSESSTGLAVRYADMDFNDHNSWDDTDIGKACRQAVDGCVELISDNLEKLPWMGRILKVNADGTLMMKPGSEGGVSTGMEFGIYRIGEDIKDPDTGLSLGAEETKIGSVKVTEDALRGKAAKAKIVAGKDVKTTDILREEKQ
ncbi:MAG: CsgG/HfaB family protein [Acidobacteriota bacterium]